MWREYPQRRMTIIQTWLGGLNLVMTVQSTQERSWELEGPDLELQITDVQGRLRLSMNFWRDVLKAPPPVLDWIQDGYGLPLWFAPNNY